MEEQWQLYDPQGRQLTGRGEVKRVVFEKAILHAASHVWMWRLSKGEVEILLQKRSSTKQTWPNLYDISAAGHVSLGEAEIETAIREAHEELGFPPNPDDIEFIGSQRVNVTADDKSFTENEIRFVYLYEIKESDKFTIDNNEVESIEWKPLSVIMTDVNDPLKVASYVPHGRAYFEMLFEALDRVTAK